MKIVQSLWSKPGEKKPGQSFAEINKCGWPSKKYNYISWTLSCLQFGKFYDEVELVTDKAGYDLLVNKLELPYTSVRVELDDLNHYDKGLFAIGKLYAYSIQDKPFIHADGDVYIWERFDKKLEDAPLMCQNLESGIDYSHWYMETYLAILEYFDYSPEILESSIFANDGVIAVNAGILGGTNIDFYKNYCREAFRFVDENLAFLSKVNIEMFNLIFEQFLYYALAEEQGIPISRYNPDFIRFWNDIADFTRIPTSTKYNHTMGVLKRSKYTVDALEYRLRTHHPEYYFRLIHLLSKNQI